MHISHQVLPSCDWVSASEDLCEEPTDWSVDQEQESTVLGFVQTTRESSPAKNKLSSPLVDKIGGQHTSATAQTVFYVVIFAHACVGWGQTESWGGAHGLSKLQARIKNASLAGNPEPSKQ